MIIDNHVHVGWFRDGYHYPANVWKEECIAGVDEICVSSTSSCAELYDLVIDEMKDLKNLAGDKVHPILWVTPKMLTGGHVRKMLFSSVQWEGIKIHPRAHSEWSEDKSLTTQVAELASSLQVPMLIHTDEDCVANADTYKYLYETHPDQLFILAHGRPLNQVLRLLPKYKNIVVDTAFMDVENIQRIAEAGYVDRMVFGTDTPINRLFVKKSTHQYIKDCISEIGNALGPEIAKSLLETTFYRRVTNNIAPS